MSIKIMKMKKKTELYIKQKRMTHQTVAGLKRKRAGTFHHALQGNPKFRVLYGVFRQTGVSSPSRLHPRFGGNLLQTRVGCVFAVAPGLRIDYRKILVAPFFNSAKDEFRTIDLTADIFRFLRESLIMTASKLGTLFSRCLKPISTSTDRDSPIVIGCLRYLVPNSVGLENM